MWTSEFVGHGLQRGRSYRYALVAREVSVGQALEAEDIVAVSPPFVAALPPVPGFLDVRPSNGSALRTPFTLETHSWQDETPLRYSFYAFKDVATLDVRNIDYSDPDSPLFFRKRNGTLLRSWVPGLKWAGVGSVRRPPSRGKLKQSCRSPTTGGQLHSSGASAEPVRAGGPASKHKERLYTCIDYCIV